jgi:hypothetical protein
MRELLRARAYGFPAIFCQIDVAQPHKKGNIDAHSEFADRNRRA